MISVIMPAYNSASFVQEAIESILRQTYTQLELIVVDDGSSDATFSIASSYVIRDPRVRVIQSDHGGPSRALNTGIQHARYDWVAIMHSDDVSLPFRLERQIKAAHGNPKVVAWGAYTYHLSSGGKILGLSKTGPSTEEEFRGLRCRGQLLTLSHPTAFLRKEIVRAAGGYDPRFDCAEDLDLFNRMSVYGPILVLPEPLLLYRIHGSSNTMARFSREKFLIRYVRARLRARLAEECEPDLEEFREQYAHRPLAARLRTYVDDTSKWYYRRFGVAFANGQYVRGTFFLWLSVLLNPRYALPRIWDQRLSSTARQWLKEKRLRIY